MAIAGATAAAGPAVPAVHADAVADADARALTRDVRGGFNMTAGPVIDADVLADVLATCPLRAPRPLIRAPTALAWRADLAPADPELLDLVRACRS